MPGVVTASVTAAMERVNWENCWPAGAVPRRTATGRSFNLQVDSTGAVIRAEADRDEPEAFMRCAAARMQHMHFESEGGVATSIQVWLRVEAR